MNMHMRSILPIVACMGMVSLGTPRCEPVAAVPEWDLATKIKTSLAKADMIVEGRFVFGTDSHRAQLSDERVMLTVQFVVEAVRKGHTDKATLTLRVPMLSLHGDVITGECDTSKLDELVALERNLEIGKIDREQYREQQRDLCEEIQRSVCTPNVSVALLDVSPGVLDHPYRNAVVPVRSGQPYVLFLLRKRAAENRQPLFASDFDIYTPTQVEMALAPDK